VWISSIFFGQNSPQVTLAVMLAGRGKLTKANAAKYVLAQIVAALLAGLVPGILKKKVQQGNKKQTPEVKGNYPL